jgi:hypothetical protein
MADLGPFKHEAFEPEITAAMSAAYERACASIETGPYSELAKEILARRIIELARQGHADADALYAEALETFGFDRGQVDRAATANK